jgi:hypothetical protein
MATCASVWFQRGRPFSSRPSTTVFGLSKTTRSGTPPEASKQASSARTSDSTRSSGTITTHTQRECFSR